MICTDALHVPVDISVVIPVFNAERTIERTLMSIVGQTSRPTEIIVVDDGSTDDTAAVVRGFNAARIRLIRQENAGVSAARNRGWGEACCEIVAFCDADDVWTPTFLETIRRLLQSYPLAVAYATSYRIVPPDAPACDARLSGLPFKGQDGIIVDYFGLAACSDPPVHSSSVAVRRSALQLVGGFPVGIVSGEDLLTWARLATVGQFAYCRLPLSSFNCPGRLDFSRTSDPRDRVGQALGELSESVPAAARPSLRKYLGRWHEMRTIIAIAHRDSTLALFHARKMLCCSGLSFRAVLLSALSCLPAPLAFALFAQARRKAFVKRLVP
jgi:hypothetical protein